MMENKAFCPLYNYLNSSDPENVFYYDLLRYVLDQKIYYYGANYSHPHEREVSNVEKFKRKVISTTLGANVRINSFLNKGDDKIKIWSTAYFNINKLVDVDNYNISLPPWSFSKKGLNLKSYQDFKRILEIKNKIDYGTVNQLLTKDFFKEIDSLKDLIKETVLREDIKAVFLASDLGFFDKLIINIFKEIKRPTFLFIHGLPGIYGKTDNNRTDYLVVWGNAIRENYIEKGFLPEKIIVNGHPKYNITSETNLKHGLDNILVLPKSMNGAPMGDEYSLGDRGNCIYYMLMIQNALKKIGVERVRFRPHPSESISWYLKYLDNDFFMPDTENLETSLKKSSLVIGPTSTVFLESLIYNINYIVFEPRLENGNCLSNYPVPAPFNGKTSKVPTAASEEELYFNITNEVKIDSSILKDYIDSSFESSLIFNKIDQFYKNSK